VEQAIEFLQQNDVKVILPEKNLVRDDELCIHCSACVGQCFSDAFSVDPETFLVEYDPEKCIACNFCIDACSYGAIESVRDHLRKTGVL
jgi:Fe-S-cluster-containing dehydrogenase component